MRTTLIEELLQAAEDADLLAFGAEKQFYATRASRLRQRAAWVREFERLWADDSFHRHELSMLTGLIPSETAPAEKERAMSTEDMLSELSRTAPLAIATEMVEGIATSCASFIAEIDADSRDVAAYLAQRLAPLAAIAAVDIRVRDALAAIGRDGRRLAVRPSRETAPTAPKEGTVKP